MKPGGKARPLECSDEEKNVEKRMKDCHYEKTKCARFLQPLATGLRHLAGCERAGNWSVATLQGVCRVS